MRNQMKRIAVMAAKRSPVGKIPGNLNEISEVELLARLLYSVSEGYQDRIAEAVVGSGFPIERDNLCRKAVLRAGLRESIPASTVSKTCASSDQALLMACRAVWAGGSGVYLVGGSENVGQNPYTLHFFKRNIKAALKGSLPELETAVKEIQENDMPILAEMLAWRYGISREEQDLFTLKSWLCAQKAHKEKRFSDEILPAETPLIAADEWLEVERNAAMLRKAEPMFVHGGTVTQYNAAAMCNCAAAMLLMGEDEINLFVQPPLGFILDGLSVAVPRDCAGKAMDQCIRLLLQRNGLDKEDIGLYEVNESFAAQAISTIRNLGLQEQNVNVNGGNLALGYPIGATGMRMGITLLYEMRRRGCRYGISTVCAGGNMANGFLWGGAEEYCYY